MYRHNYIRSFGIGQAPGTPSPQVMQCAADTLARLQASGELAVLLLSMSYEEIQAQVIEACQASMTQPPLVKKEETKDSKVSSTGVSYTTLALTSIGGLLVGGIVGYYIGGSRM